MNQSSELQQAVSNECPQQPRKVGHGKAARSGPPGNKNAVKHGYYSLVRMIKSRGGALDRRTILGKMVMETVRRLESDLGGDLSEAQRMLVEDVALDTLLIQAVNRQVASVQPIRKGKAHAAYQLRAQLIAQRREHLKLLGLQRRVKTPSLADLLSQQGDNQERSDTSNGIASDAIVRQ
jgi:hypothetical protein